jgi:hypothetical protein
MPPINLSSSYTQNFDSLANSGTGNPWSDDSTITGWYFNRQFNNIPQTYNAGTGSSNAGALYSFGAISDSERALGSVASGSTGTILWGISLVNDTSEVISDLDISFVGEQWRNGGNTASQTLDFQYQIGAIGINSGTWTDFDSLDFTSPTVGSTASALDGNAAANQTNISATLTGLNLAPGEEIWLRWQDLNDAGNDHALAIDDFSVTADGEPPTGTIVTIQAIDSNAAEPTNPGTFRITRTGDSFTDLIVNYTIATGTSQAENGTDYTPTITGTATIPTSQSFIDITITPTDDSIVEGNETVTLTLVDAADYNLGAATIATVIIADDDVPPPVKISEIQGAAHISPLVGQTVNNVAGIVTVVRSNGFYFQDPNPDADDATSEAMFVFTSSAPSVAVGDSILVNGTVTEFRPGGSGGTNNLTTTEITSPSITILSSGNALPIATVIGDGGRTIPDRVIDNDAVGGNVENAGSLFDPAEDGIDFYESLEGMLVQINNAVVVGPTSDFGEIPVLADNGVNASGRTDRGGIRVQPGDFNPERIILDDAIVTTEPQVNVGDRFEGSIVGVIDYSFSNFKFFNTTSLTPTSGGLTKETTSLQGTQDQLTVAAFNVENLDPGDSSTIFANLANRIVNNLNSPDILSLEEIQDNNGPTNDSVVDANVTLQLLIDAIAAAGGPIYEFRQINPVDDLDGGQPGGNIRVGFLFNPSRVSFVDRPGGDSTTDTTVTSGVNGAEISASPGRIIDTDLSDGDAFANSRKPLVGEFLFNGNKIFVIGNHFNSKGGDQPLFGPFQPPTLTSEIQRLQQAREVSNFVNEILAIEPNANIVVAGDLNDFEFSNPLSLLTSNGLNNLFDLLPQEERYTYNFEGNAQILDHILASDNLANNAAPEIDVVHINSEFADQDSDHDPLVSRFTLPTLINGTFNADSLVGSDRDEVINGFDGNDSLDGGNGNDSLDGGIGNKDRLLGGAGNDTIIDPDGVISARGGAGNDTISITFAADWDNNNNPNDAPRSNGRISGGAGDDTISVFANNANFSIELNPVSETSNDGNDVISLQGSYRNSLVSLGGGNDIFNGGDGSDRVFGGSGNDILTGGGSNDIFVLSTTGTDTITDFIDGEDLLGLCDIFFEQLTITQGTGTNQNDTLISLSSSAETLAILQNVSSSSIDSADFIMV